MKEEKTTLGKLSAPARELLARAREARERAYAPYSGFAVGAALLGKSGAVYLGANIENSSFTPTVCAERVALFSAIMAGEREFSGLAVVGGPQGKEEVVCSPCGVCRQALSEFCEGEMPVSFLGEEGFCEVPFSALYPMGFRKA